MRDYEELIEIWVRNFRNTLSEYKVGCGDGDTPSGVKIIFDGFGDLDDDEGNKYLKVVTHGGSAHTFICKKDAGKFKKGDILMAASWNAPARNFARGNVIAKEFGSINCYGA